MWKDNLNMLADHIIVSHIVLKQKQVLHLFVNFVFVFEGLISIKWKPNQIVKLSLISNFCKKT